MEAQKLESWEARKLESEGIGAAQLIVQSSELKAKGRTDKAGKPGCREAWRRRIWGCPANSSELRAMVREQRVWCKAKKAGRLGGAGSMTPSSKLIASGIEQSEWYKGHSVLHKSLT